MPYSGGERLRRLVDSALLPSNPSGSGQGDVAALLRRVAYSLDQLGEVQVGDITFHSAVTDGEDDLSVTVYYDREPCRR